MGRHLYKQTLSLHFFLHYACPTCSIIPQIQSFESVNFPVSQGRRQKSGSFVWCPPQSALHAVPYVSSIYISVLAKRFLLASRLDTSKNCFWVVIPKRYYRFKVTFMTGFRTSNSMYILKETQLFLFDMIIIEQRMELPLFCLRNIYTRTKYKTKKWISF